jgi:hypothetical protein
MAFSLANVKGVDDTFPSRSSLILVSQRHEPPSTLPHSLWSKPWELMSTIDPLLPRSEKGPVGDLTADIVSRGFKLRYTNSLAIRVHANESPFARHVNFPNASDSWWGGFDTESQ